MTTLKTSTLILSIILFSVITGSCQYMSIEGRLGSLSYSDSDSSFGHARLKVGYELANKICFDLEFVSSRAEYEVRMPNIQVEVFNTVGVLLNLLTVSNHADWSTTKTKEVYKSYNRSMYTYSPTIGYRISPHFKFYIGPSIKHNSIQTTSTEEPTYYGSLFSELEFNDYTNYGYNMGVDYRYGISDWAYLTCGVQLQTDLYSSSSKVSGSKFIGNAVSYDFGIGFRIGTKNNNNNMDVKINQPRF